MLKFLYLCLFTLISELYLANNFCSGFLYLSLSILLYFPVVHPLHLPCLQNHIFQYLYKFIRLCMSCMYYLSVNCKTILACLSNCTSYICYCYKPASCHVYECIRCVLNHSYNVDCTRFLTNIDE